jgi:hypothetical protein
VIVIDEYLAVRVLGGDWPEGLPDDDDLGVVRWPHPEVLTVLDPRPLLDEAARITARFGGGWVIGETLAAALAHGRRLYYGSPDNIGGPERNRARNSGST